MHHHPVTVSAALTVWLGAGAALALPAFPGAEGYGADTIGGRGGRVIAVTSIADSGVGTLREALATPGPRIIVFRVAGIITLESPLLVEHPYLTVAGHTAPGSGVLIRNKTTAPYGLAADSFTSLVLDTHDVVIRHLAIRPGVWPANPACGSKNALPHPNGWSTCVDANNVEAIALGPGSHHVILDHLSLALGTDEIIDIGGASDVTLQWSIVSDGYRSFPYCGFSMSCPKYRGMGVITGDTTTAAAGFETTRLTMHHNLWAHLMARAPQIAAAESDIRNNLTYNWSDFGADVNNLLSAVRANVVGNVYLAGPDTVGEAAGRGLTIHDWGAHANGLVPGAPLRVYLFDNSGAPAPRCTRWRAAVNNWESCPADLEGYLAPPVQAPRVVTEVAAKLEDTLLAGVGASVRLDGAGHMNQRRDAYDARVVQDVRARTGRAPRHTATITWPVVVAGSPDSDVDQDGMPDDWERIHRLSVTLPDGAADRDADGYTNMEEFLNGTEP